ncbi:hypothetical protein ASF68_06880 [Plantibacter sp. Leaf314]|nr:hypothetical protein ASF68_06880 [Plantibacter sp. Leaf314]
MSKAIIDALGKLVVASGRVEHIVVLALRGCLDKTDEDTKKAFTRTMQFASSCDAITRTLKSESFSEVDPKLATDWANWQSRASGFMKTRNALLHSSIENSPGGAVAFTLKGPEVVTRLSAEGIIETAEEGQQLFYAGINFGERIQNVVWSDRLSVDPPTDTGLHRL